MPPRVMGWFLRRLLAAVERQPPSLTIGSAEDPYLLRWHPVPHNRLLNVYPHRMFRSDDDRALHDHPWWNISVVLDGRYVEHRILAGGIHVRLPLGAGEIRLRSARTAHRIEVEPGVSATTLFLTGPVVRNWGFHCPGGWVPHEVFVDLLDHGRVGRGCG